MKQPWMTPPMLVDIELRPEICILHCKGCFVAGQDPEYLRNKVDEIKNLNCSKVIADFREVQSIGSMGIAFLVGVYTSVVRKSGGRFVLAGARPFVNRVLDLTKLSTVIPLTEDLTSALAILCGG
ncbi:MAG TPA: STAS domain-containing protein [Bryobacteraceae bacterium]|jgi:anti-anti-sigma factor|nr:STAS domain-containing protein [Bryobacteraceae bacterium]